MSEAQSENSFITAPQLFERWQCSHMFVVALLKRDSDFPRPVYFGRHRRWRVSEIEAYEKLLAGRPRPKKAKISDAA
jgi:predicted DNA-binding transcriptional regulator AlpA